MVKKMDLLRKVRREECFQATGGFGSSGFGGVRRTTAGVETGDSSFATRWPVEDVCAENFPLVHLLLVKPAAPCELNSGFVNLRLNHLRVHLGFIEILDV